MYSKLVKKTIFIRLADRRWSFTYLLYVFIIITMLIMYKWILRHNKAGDFISYLLLITSFSNRLFCFRSEYLGWPLILHIHLLLSHNLSSFTLLPVPIVWLVADNRKANDFLRVIDFSINKGKPKTAEKAPSPSSFIVAYVDTGNYANKSKYVQFTAWHQSLPKQTVTLKK